MTIASRYRAFYERHASTLLGIIGGVLLSVAIVLTIVALDVRSRNNESARQAQASCVRSMRLAPALVDDYARRRVFQRRYGDIEGAKRLIEARDTIPKHC